MGEIMEHREFLGDDDIGQGDLTNNEDKTSGRKSGGRMQSENTTLPSGSVRMSEIPRPSQRRGESTATGQDSKWDPSHRSEQPSVQQSVRGSGIQPSLRTSQEGSQPRISSLQPKEASLQPSGSHHPSSSHQPSVSVPASVSQKSAASQPKSERPSFEQKPPVVLPPGEVTQTSYAFGKITVEAFGYYEQYEPPAVCPATGEDIIRKYTLSNNNGVSVEIINYGASVISIKVPDKNGKVSDVLLGFDNINDYICECDQHYMGTTTGRYTGLISNAEFSVGIRNYYLTNNFGQHHINGGCLGFDKVFWQSFVKKDRVYMTYTSADREECYPGCLLVQTSFHLTSDNSLVMETTATSSMPTPVCISHCLFFNLAGHDAGPDGLKEHCLMLNADRYVVVDKESQVPTGELRGVGATYYDFRVPRPLSKALEKSPDKGYDETFCLTKGYMKHSITFAARATHPPTGRVVELFTDHPGVHFYTASDFPNPDAPKKEAPGSIGEYFQSKNPDDDDGGVGKEFMAQAGPNAQWPRSASLPSGVEDGGSPTMPNIDDEECETPPPRDLDLEDPDYFPRKEITTECTADEEMEPSSATLVEQEVDEEEWVPPKLLKGKMGALYRNHCGFALVPMDYPDSMKFRHFPNPMLFPGETYNRTVMFRFTVAEQRVPESPSAMLRKLMEEQEKLKTGEGEDSRETIPSHDGTGSVRRTSTEGGGGSRKPSVKNSSASKQEESIGKEPNDGGLQQVVPRVEQTGTVEE